ncbi:DMT family transporter [Microbacterium sp. P05]|uniref:DMT family transporter n=1 Tax=Microbacterium sp. P05 TaxID=3366948 RepID=UPI003747493E
MSTAPVTRFTPRAWLLFATMAVLWGVPYLFIKEAVESLSPPAVVCIRTLGAALLLLPFALRRGVLRPALRQWRWVLVFALLEMAGPFLLLAHAEQTLPSGITGLLVATVPLFAAIIAFAGGDRSALKPLRLAGLVVGFAGVAVLVAGPGLSFGDGPLGALAIAEVLLVAVCYSIAPFVVTRHLREVPALGSVTLSLLIVGVLYLPAALLTTHSAPTARSVVSVVALTVLCTAVAFLVFFALIGAVGPARAPLFTYLNPIVAILLGVVVLGEHLSPALLLGFPLVVLGCWLAATGGRLRVPRDAPPPVAPG